MRARSAFFGRWFGRRKRTDGTPAKPRGRGWRIAKAFVCALAVALVALLFAADSAGPVQAAVGGPIYLSGDDSNDGGHCDTATSCGGLMARVIDDVVTGSGNAGATDIAAIGVSGSALNALNNWNGAAAGGPYTIQILTTTSVPSIATAASTDFSGYKTIFIPSASGHTFGGINSTNLAALNAVQTNVTNFINTLGGGIVALTEGGVTGAYGWLPIPLTTLSVTHSSGDTIIPTAAMATLSPATTSANLSHCCWHNVFTGPSGFLGLNVLAFHDHNGNGSFDLATDHAVIIGGGQVTIQGNIALAPLTDTNPAGTTHTVTATAQDGNPLVPAVGVTVTFQVTSGPNTGEVSNPGECSVNANCTTDANGQVSWTYTGSGGTGTDTIAASFVDTANNTQTSNTVQKIWQPGPTITPTQTPDPVGGVGFFPDSAGSSDSSSVAAFTGIAAIATAVALTGVAWYARNRRVRR